MDVLAQGLAHKAAFREALHGLAEGFRQRLDAPGTMLVAGAAQRRPVVGRGHELKPLLDARQARGQHDGEGQVGVRRRVGLRSSTRQAASLFGR